MNPGYTTTEWYSSLLTNLIAVLTLFHVGIQNPSPIIQAVAVLGAAVGNAVYAHARQKVKEAYANTGTPLSTAVLSTTPDPVPASATTASAT